jgi:hypothetical protein
MKLPKNKSSVYAVVRYSNSLLPSTLIGVFLSLEAADNFAGACKQEWIDKGLFEENGIFGVELTTFYAE